MWYTDGVDEKGGLVVYLETRRQLDLPGAGLGEDMEIKDAQSWETGSCGR